MITGSIYFSIQFSSRTCSFITIITVHSFCYAKSRFDIYFTCLRLCICSKRWDWGRISHKCINKIDCIPVCANPLEAVSNPANGPAYVAIQRPGAVAVFESEAREVIDSYIVYEIVAIYSIT